jgi:flagellar motor switch protein FliM
VEGLPTYRATLGKVKDNYALKINKKINRPEIQKTSLQLEDLKEHKEHKENKIK